MIVHVSGDFPDAVSAAKTPVIARLIGLVGNRFEQEVLSLNRKSPAPGQLFGPVAQVVNGPSSRENPLGCSLTSITYFAPGQGLLHRTLLLRLGNWIARATARTRPRLIVGYKLTIEGFAVARAAQRLDCPYAVVIQGNTDCRILRVRPDLRSSLAQVFHGAAMVFAFAPWALAETEEYLGVRAGPKSILPCPMANDTLVPPRPGGGDLVSAFHLRNWRIKNADRLMTAAERAQAEEPALRLSIIGGGNAQDSSKVKALASGKSAVHLAGPCDHSHMAGRLNAAKGYIMPSRWESFGLTFIEALFAGTPIAFPRGTAVEGYFEGQSFALPVDAKDTQAIARAMLDLYRREPELKDALRRWQEGQGPQMFTRPAIARRFATGLELALRAAP